MPLTALRPLRVLDTTLRDGDQAAGCAFTLKQKLLIARLLEEAGVDCIEAGFPLSSKADFDSCRLIASEIRTSTVAVMTRSSLQDIRVSSEALEGAAGGMLHLSLPVSSLHIKTKLRTTEADILHLVRECVSFASGLAATVEIGAEDATRADRAFLLDYCGEATEAGARIVNISDTVGHAVPHEFAGLIRFLLESVPAFRSGRSILSVHCHNDFGLANANTLSGITAGCGQIEVTGMGIGERSGNAALEEIAALLVARADLYLVRTRLVPASIAALTRVLSGILGTDGAPFKPVTGRNARAHASGIHQQGISLDRRTYSPAGGNGFSLTPERIVLGRHSGKTGLAAAVKQYAGLALPPAALSSLLDDIKSESAESSSLGVSELLGLLHQKRRLSAAPYRCASISVAETRVTGESHYSITAKLGRGGTDGDLQLFTASGSNWNESVFALVSQIFPPKITPVVLSFSGFCDSATSTAAPPAMRFYLEASVETPEKRTYALERTGTNRDKLLLECLLDIVNAENCLTPSP